MRAPAEEHVREALDRFAFGTVTACERYGSGHINDTFCVENSAGKRFILQRVNTEIFQDPAALMENISGVTRFLREKIKAEGGDPQRETLTVIPDTDGEAYVAGSGGDAWRAYLFVEGTFCLQQAENAEQFEACAEAFGRFQQLLGDYPAASLHETIVKFHDTRDRFRLFQEALAKDPLGRAKNIPEEIEFVLAREQDCGVLMNLLDEGKLPLRVTHNDTKLNNILFDEATGGALCIIDLDTVMPGLALHDYGDSIRFGANHNAEDEPDQEKVAFDLPLFECYTRGFLKTAGSALTACETEHLPWGAKLMTLECGIRFLTDYLLGDTYFKTSRPDHNLDRARTQFTLVRGMEGAWDDMNRIVRKYSR